MIDRFSFYTWSDEKSYVTGSSCTDSSYSSFYSSRDPPVVTELGQPVHAEVFVLKLEDGDLELLLDDCWATATENPHDPQRWKLLVKGSARKTK